jgi:hypothetical protein
MFKSTCFLAFSTAIGFISLSIPTAPAQQAPNSDDIEVACPDEPKLREKPRLVRDLTTWVMLISPLEIQGNGNFELRYEFPETSCDKDVIKTNAGTAKVLYSPFDAELESLLYRAVIEDMAEPREIVVLYAEIVTAVRNRGFHFYIAESRGEKTYFYAMYRDQPRYEAIRPILVDILNGKATVLIAVEWPKGSNDALIVEIDKNLK